MEECSFNCNDNAVDFSHKALKEQLEQELDFLTLDIGFLKVLTFEVKFQILERMMS